MSSKSYPQSGNLKIKMQKSKLQIKNEKISKTWQKVKFGDYIDLIRGVSYTSSSLRKSKEGIYLVNLKNVDKGGGFRNGGLKEYAGDYKDKQLVEEGDIIIALTDLTPNAEVIGMPALIPKLDKLACISMDLVKIKVKNENLLDKKYLYYLLNTKEYKGWIRGFTNGVNVLHLKTEGILEFEAKISKDISEQKRIADILSAFDHKIELNNKINQTLEQMAQVIFKEWLSQNQKSKIKSQKLWKVSKVNNLIEIISGYSFSSKIYNKGKRGLGVVTIKNVQDGSFITKCDSFINEDDIPKNMNSECRIYDGDILLSLTGNVGRVCFVYGGEYLLNQRVAKLKPKNEKDCAFCYFLFRQPILQNQLINMAKGSAQSNLSPVETGETTLSIPPRTMLDKFNELAPIYNRLVQNAIENQKLVVLRNLLLPKLMSGEIKA